jgi:hypothetical protein
MKQLLGFIDPEKAVHRNILFFLVLLGLAWAYSYPAILPMRPVSVHQWRQTDCLSLADNYYEGNWNLFSPSLHLLFSDQESSGKSAGEFPILYYIVALLWKVFGKHEFIFRLLTVSISFAGLFSLFKLSYSLLKDLFWSLATVVFLFSSPIYVYYSNNFLINVPAFSFMLIALWFFHQFWQTGKNNQLYLSMLFFLLVGLLKISTLMSFVIIGLIFLLETLNYVKFKTKGRVFTQPLKQGASFLVVIAGVVIWYLYASHYNSVHGGKYTLNYIQTYWSTGLDQIHAALKSLKNFIVFQVMSLPSFLYIILCLLYLVANFRKLEMIWRIAIPVLMIGYYCFIMLFFYSLNSHDYYHIDFLIIPLVIHLAFLRFLHLKEEHIFKSVLSKYFFSAFLFWNVFYCANNMQMRFWGPGEANSSRQLLAAKVDVDGWAYYHWAYKNKAYETVTPVLRDMGIKRSDAVICPDDFSYSITLYLMDQVGWTNVDSQLKDSASIADRIRHGAKYMMVVDTAIEHQSFLKSFERHQLRRYQDMRIYDLRPYTTHPN